MNRSVWFPGDLAARVQARADELDRSFNWVVARALESTLGDGLGREDRRVSPPSSAPSRASEDMRIHKDFADARELPPGVEKGTKNVKTRDTLAMERQRKLNERKS